ncbi:MAG: hypothetical protein RLZZ214_2758, partial [Verrucomicrobiota bacterium]
MPLQLPPDDPTLTVGSFEIDSPLWWKKSGIWLVGLIIMIVCFGWLMCPTVIRSKKEPNQSEAVSNARQIGLALFEFETEYGKFPDVSTTSPVRRKSGTLLA